MSRRRLAPLAAVAIAGTVALCATGAAAQTQMAPICGVSGNATASASIVYDPFASSGLSQATIPLTLRRNRLDAERTNEVSLILVAPGGDLPIEISYQGYNVLYPEGATAGRPRALNSTDGGAGAAGEIRYSFGSSINTPDVSTPLNLRVTVPPGTDLGANQVVYLDMVYICSGLGGMLDVPNPVRQTRALRLDLNIVSALQAYYAGSALNFGEIGDVTTQAVQAAPASYTTSGGNSVRVRSSGPYEVTVRSQNDFRLTYPGGSLANAAQTIRYAVRFLGRDINANAAFGTRSCTRAGVSGGASLPIRATLLEGGAGKMPSQNYADTISITFTPVVTATAAQSCTGL